MNEVGRLLVTAVSEMEKRLDPVSLTLNKFPTVPLVPMLIEKRSPVAVVDEPGDQSIPKRFPVVSPVEVEKIFTASPEVRELAL